MTSQSLRVNLEYMKDLCPMLGSFGGPSAV